MNAEPLSRSLPVRAVLALALPFLAAVSAFGAASETVTLRVHADRPGARVSPSLYGVFFEEINHAGEGGLYAELVRNRAFKETTPLDGRPVGWSLRAEGQAQGKMALDTLHPLNEANPRSLRLDVTVVPSGRISVVNGGYWGIPVRKGASYRLSMYARRSAELRSPLTVSLEGEGGQVYARATVEGLTPDWKRFERRLTATTDDPSARLVLSASAPGSVWLDVVSLFPTDTWKRRPNGLRADLAGKVSALRPGFVRFPGGCYVEGNYLANAFRWKRTLGDIAERPGHVNDNWGYRSTDGLGFHEYLQMCEDMGAEPLFVVNCGMAHRDQAPMDRLQPWIQDALDAIEYGNGPVTSHWGALRARSGHPAPFHLRYVEIGNENGLFGGFGGTREQYAQRYRAFYDAIKARFPTIQTIADTRVPHPLEIVDEHFYNSPGWFWANIDHYDDYDRSGPRIYVGEYAVTQGCGRGNLRAALAEAAFLTGLERNSDIVRMASYAPLFVNVNDRRWNPDAIVFDAARSYGTPSYYVQKLFSENRADTVLPLEISGAAPQSPATGGIGLGTWLTQAEYKDVEVIRNGKTVYASDIAPGAPHWRPVRGDWQVVDGAYRQSGSGSDRRALLSDPTLDDAQDYTLHLKARKLGGAEGFLILFHARDDDNYYWWNIGGWGNREHGLEKGAGGAKIPLGRHAPGRIETGRWYDVRIELTGPRIRCYLDGQLIHDVQDRPVPTFAAVAGKAKKGEVIIKAVNGSESPLPAAIHLERAGRLRSTGEAIVLTSGSLDDENSLDQPIRVAPVSARLTGVSSRFAYTFPARSVTVLRLKQ